MATEKLRIVDFNEEFSVSGCVGLVFGKLLGFIQFDELLESAFGQLQLHTILLRASYFSGRFLHFAS